MKIVILPEALRDLQETAHFYDDQEPGLGIEVYQFLETEIEGLKHSAGIHPMRFHQHRMVVRGRFPYFCVYYRVLDGTAFVNAVTDQRRDPEHLLEILRLRG